MFSLEEARERIAAAVSRLGEETVPMARAAGRFAARDHLARIDLPPFDNSAMDGFAVRAADLATASAANPVVLRQIGVIGAGSFFPGTVRSGECIRIFTGSPLPAGADAVVMQEDVEKSDTERFQFNEAVRPWEHVRFRGEDVKAGMVVAAAGDRFTPGRIALSAATGVGGAIVGRMPRVGLLATGSELVEAGEAPGPAQIYESNRAALSALVLRAGGIPELLPLVPDEPDKTVEALRAALVASDLVITSGGVSVGEFDFVKEAFGRLGGTLDFWRVAIKPGKPFVFGRLGGKFLFGLPGNPVSALVTFRLLVQPALLRMQGSLADEPAERVILGEALANDGDRHHFVRVCTAPNGRVVSAGPQASHRLLATARSSGLVEVPPGAVLPAGSEVDFLRW